MATFRPAFSTCCFHSSATGRLHLPVNSRFLHHRRRVTCLAAPEKNSSDPAPVDKPEASSTTTTTRQPDEVAQPQASKAPLLAKGQGTAIITGAISVLFGIGYLVLVQLLDMRGNEMLPPPPEAFGP